MEGPPPVPRSFLRGALGPLSRVFAAGAVAGDSETLAEKQTLPSCVPEHHYPESGWGRLRELFVNGEKPGIPEEVDSIIRASAAAGVIGFAYGGIPGFINAKQRYIEQSQAEIFHNRFDAVQCAHRAATRGFIRYGWRWSWRTAVFVGIFNTVNTGLTVYRNKNALSHFVIAGAVTGSLFRINLGVRGLVAGGVIGALLGTPLACLMTVLQKYYGETLHERKQKDWQALHEQKLEEWKARLQFTELLPEEIESRIKESQSKDDVSRIEALLSRPRNPLPSETQDED
ncbi:complex I assembly factor TIMMDC1, mitochondrial [Ctenodactylus gundi]